MKKMLFTAIHPAPYIDTWILGLKKYYAVDVAYNYKESAAKTWREYKPINGVVIKEYGLAKWTRLIKKNDIIVLNGWNNPYNIYALIIALLLHKKTAVFSDYPVEIKKGSLKWFLKNAFLSLLVPRILCATHSTQEYYRDVFSYKEENTIFFPYATKEPLTTNEFNLRRIKSIERDGQIKIFVANNFRARKGYDVLTEALGLLEGDLLKQIDLIIAGSGELKEEYSKKIKQIVSDVKLLGWIEEEEYSDLLKNTDLFIHASTFEPFGIPPIDAMKYGKALIVSDGVKSVSSIIVNSKNGFIFHAGNAKDLAEKLAQAISMKERLYQIGENGKRDICKIYNNEFLDNLNL